MPLDDLIAKGWTFAGDESPTPPPPPRFSDAEIAALKERRRLAKASPLRKQTCISFSLPSLYPEAVYSPDIAPFSSPNRLRHASSTLLRVWTGPSETRTSEIKLIKGIHKGSNEKAQVWRAEARVEGRKRKVIVKLYAEALFPLPESNRWQSASRKVETEAQGYTSFRSTQGIDVPICYGFYDFDVPWGEKAPGVILEDLTEIATPLREWGKNYLKPKKEVVDEDSDVEAMSSESEDDGEESVTTSGSRQEVIERQTKELERFILQLFEDQRRLHTLEHTTNPSRGNHVLALNTSTVDKPHFVFLSFSRTLTKRKQEEHKRKEYARMSDEKGEDFAKAVMVMDFRDYSEIGMSDAVEIAFGEQIAMEWRALNLFDFVEDRSNHC